MIGGMTMEYMVKRMAAPDWDEVQRVKLTDVGWLPPAQVRAWAQLCHDGVTLYVRLEAEESPIRATLTGKLDQVCDDSCLEFFFAPDWEDQRYFNFEFNFLGALNLGFGGLRPSRVRQIVKKPEELFRPEPFETGKGWGICYQIPAEFVRRYFPDFQLTGTGGCNFYKCGDRTERPHYMSWAPMMTEKPDFHRRQDFGMLRFE